MTLVGAGENRAEPICTRPQASALVGHGGHLLKRSSSRKTLCGVPIATASRGATCATCLRVAGKLLTPKPVSKLELEAERLVADACHNLGLPEPEREHKFAVSIGRMWRFDFAWPDQRVALEIDGDLWNGRHTSGDGRRDDMVRDAFALLDGWRVFRVDALLLRQGYALKWLEIALVDFPLKSRIADHIERPGPNLFPKLADIDPARAAPQRQKAKARK